MVCVVALFPHYLCCGPCLLLDACMRPDFCCVSGKAKGEYEEEIGHGVITLHLMGPFWKSVHTPPPLVE